MNLYSHLSVIHSLKYMMWPFGIRLSERRRCFLEWVCVCINYFLYLMSKSLVYGTNSLITSGLLEENEVHVKWYNTSGSGYTFQW